jgi:cytochrome oxidase Cu insertion factor (SCO1/SenC/PrrC family)
MRCNSSYRRNGPRAAGAWRGAGLFALALFAISANGDDASGAVLEFTPPAPGSYRLERIMPAADGTVLDLAGRQQRLSQYTSGKVTVLSFVYSSCADPEGCPYAYLVFNLLKNAIEIESALHNRIRLVTLSFDPKRDTPEAMAHYAGTHAQGSPVVQWTFLTTPSVRELKPILDGYGQDVYVEVDAKTMKPTGAFSHVLKLFLIDRHGQVREIYMSGFFTPEVVLNDIKTLLMEDGVTLR